MHAARVAELLTIEGWDIVAVAATPNLRGIPDADLLEHAAASRRALVTENVADFSLLANRWASEGKAHAGLVYTSPRRFNRASLAYEGKLLDALRRFLETPPVDGLSWTWWL